MSIERAEVWRLMKRHFTANDQNSDVDYKRGGHECIEIDQGFQVHHGEHANTGQLTAGNQEKEPLPGIVSAKFAKLQEANT